MKITRFNGPPLQEVPFGEKSLAAVLVGANRLDGRWVMPLFDVHEPIRT